jgi:hypothetical protein
LSSSCCASRVAPAWAQPGTAQKKVITHDVYDSWKSIQGTKISADGTWIAYALTPQEGDGELVLRNLKTNAEIRAPRGRDPLITSDNTFVVYAIAPLKKDVDQARKAKRKPEDMPKNGVGFVNLATGQATTVAEHVKSFRVPDDTPKIVVYLTVAAETGADTGANGRAASPKTREKKPSGTDLVIRDLASGAQTTVAEVSDYALSKDGAWLVYAVSSKTAVHDGAFARSMASGAVRNLLTGPGNYKGFVFDGGRGRPRSSAIATTSRHPRLASSSITGRLQPTRRPELPIPAGASMIASENGRLEFSKDGGRLFFGTAAPPAAEPADESTDTIKVDIWNYKDAEIQPMQKVRAEQEKKRTYRAVFHLADKRFAQLATREMPDVRTSESSTFALGRQQRAVSPTGVVGRQL